MADDSLSSREENLRIYVDMSPREVAEFFERLASDDEFRSRFEQETGTVLREYHIHIPQEIMPETIQLPPKEELRAALESLSSEQMYPFDMRDPFWRSVGFSCWFIFFGPPHRVSTPNQLRE